MNLKNEVGIEAIQREVSAMRAEQTKRLEGPERMMQASGRGTRSRSKLAAARPS